MGLLLVESLPVASSSVAAFVCAAGAMSLILLIALMPWDTAVEYDDLGGSLWLGWVVFGLIVGLLLAISWVFIPNKSSVSDINSLTSTGTSSFFRRATVTLSKASLISEIFKRSGFSLGGVGVVVGACFLGWGKSLQRTWCRVGVFKRS